jgi:S-DNA-T family DNA segregation ATPase FtsK/SpoIIIE
VRFTLGPAGDVEVPDGATLGECRPRLAALAPEAGTARLVVDGVPLVAEQVAGVPPWVHGSRVRTSAAPDPVASAARSPWHLAVLTGPDAGQVAVPGPDGAIVVGRVAGGDTLSRALPARRQSGGSAADGPGGLWLTDPAVSRTHLLVRGAGLRRTRWRAGDAGSANGTMRLRGAGARRGRRRVHRFGRRIRLGDRIALGATTLELRPGPVPRSGSEPRPGIAPRGGEPVAGAPPVSGAPSTATWLVPVAVSALLAAATRNPIFLVFAAAGPAGAVVPAVARRLRARTPSAPELGPDAPACSLLLATANPRDPDGLPPPGWLGLAREGLAVVGAAESVLAVGRALLGGALLDDDLRLTILHPPTADVAWSWLRWLESRLGSSPAARVARTAEDAARVLGAGPDPVLVVSDRGTPWRAALDRWWRGRRSQDAVLLLDTRRDAVPSWCRWVLTVAGDGAILDGPGGAWRVEPPAACLSWAEAHARRVAAHDTTRRPARNATVGPDGLPTSVGLADLGVPDDVPAILASWGHPRVTRGRPLCRLAVTIGVGTATGPPGAATSVDLLAEGPHALVAGTTGAGKSELLQSLILSLALRHPPSEVAMVLVDYKGGASFGPCAELPHVVGQVTDLGPVEAARALDGLRWELRRREELLAAAGLTDLELLRARGPAPPRLLVVVDEFRAITEDLPDFVPSLVRLAAQGRSLGVHLVLATQRPAGAVDAQMRANLALRICLRVTEPADSTDVLDVPDAASLPAGVPGRAVLRRGSGPVEVVQTAWAALPRRARSGVRWAPGWSAFGRAEEPVGTDHCEQLVRAARAAARSAGIPSPARVWLPPLPPDLRSADLPAVGEGIPIGLTDPPGGTAWGVLTWDGTGLLVVAGRHGSGRTTTLATVARAALRAGFQVHLAAGTDATAQALAGPAGEAPLPHPGLGTVLSAADPRRLARLIGLLLAGHHPRLLVVDDVDLAIRALDRLPRSAGVDLWDRAIREGRHTGLALAVSGTPTEVSRLLPHGTERLVLPVADAHDDVLLGVSRSLGGARARPGQAVHLDGHGAVRCQVALPGEPVTRVSPSEPAEGADRIATGGPDRAGQPGPPRLAPLPLQVRYPPTPPDPNHLPLGRGGDRAEPITVGLETGVLVVGPTGSGRSTALATLAVGLRAAGRPPVIVARSGPLAELGRLDPSRHAETPGPARDLMGRTRAGAGPPPVFVLDDLDGLARSDPALDEEVAGWVVAAERGDRAPVVIAAARTDRVASAYRGVLAALRVTASLVVLTPLEPGSADVVGSDLAVAVDPAHPRHPGRGVVVHRGQVTPVQVAQVRHPI